MRVRPFLVLILCFASAGFLLDCGRDKEPPPRPRAAVIEDVVFLPGFENRKPDDGGSFVRAIPGEPSTLNPVLAGDQISYLVYKWVFDPLIDVDQSRKFVGVLAESWAYSADGKVLTFHLRKGVKWHDGAPFTADDVIFTYEAAMDPSVDAVNKRPSFEKVAKVEKLDAYTVKVTWKEPYAPGLASWSSFAIMPKHVYAYPAGKGDQFNRHPRNEQPVGTGPFTFSEWRRGEKIILKVNASYFRGRPHLDEVVFRVIQSPQEQFKAYKAGEIDLAGLSAEEWEKVKDDPMFLDKSFLFENWARMFYCIGWNMDGSNPFFEDRRVRQAMTYALDRRAVVDKLLGGHAMVAAGPFYARSWEGNPAITPYPCDPARASALLDEAGWKDTNGDGIREKDGKPLSFECLVPAEVEMFSRLLDLFRQDLKKVGVDMKIRKLEWSVFLDRTKRHQFQAYLSGWGMGDDPDPFQYLHSSQAKLLPSGISEGQNDCSYVNPEVDRLIEEERRNTDPMERLRCFWKIHEAIHEDQPFTFLFADSQLAAVRNRFQNVRVSQCGYGLFTWYPSMLDWWVPKEMQR